jgi:hypothetical protein
VSFDPSEPRVPAGSAGGGRWGGGARSDSAAKAQASPKAQAMHQRLVETPKGKRSDYLRGLSDADLELLSEAIYGSRTSDPQVVAARIAVANELARRGIDVKDHGALGGGPSRKGKAPAPVRRPAPAAARKPAAAPAAKPTPAQVRYVATRSQGTAGTGQKRAI